MKIILHLNEGSDGILALRSAKALVRDGYEECAYRYESGAVTFARKNKSGSITVYEDTQQDNSNDR